MGNPSWNNHQEGLRVKGVTGESQLLCDDCASEQELATFSERQPQEKLPDSIAKNDTSFTHPVQVVNFSGKTVICVYI